MEAILEFFVNNYMWFLVISLILIFGLIGYIVDVNEKKSPKLHFQKDEDISVESDVVSKEKTLNDLLKENEIQANKEIIKPVEMIDSNDLQPADDNQNLSDQELS